jgi:hypothetical protein
MANTLRAATQFCQPQVACKQSLGNATQCNATKCTTNQMSAQHSIYRSSLPYYPEHRTQTVSTLAQNIG